MPAIYTERNCEHGALGRVLYSTAVLFTDRPVFLNGIQLAKGILMGDGLLLSNGLLVSDGLLLSGGMLLSDGLLVNEGTQHGDRPPALRWNAALRRFTHLRWAARFRLNTDSKARRRDGAD